MPTNTSRTHSGAVMQIIGAVMVVVTAIWLFGAEEAIPVRLIIAGGGALLLGVGAAMRRSPG